MLELSASAEAKACMFTAELARVCLRIPSAWEFVDGIHPWSTDKENAKGAMWEVPKAIAAEQFFYLNQLSDHINDGRDGYFTAAYPDLTPGIDGQRDMTWSQWHDLKGALRLQDTLDFVKHLVNLHNGEARVLRGDTWTRLGRDEAEAVWHQRCWHYQFAINPAVRDWLYWRCAGSPANAPKLMGGDLNWLLSAEVDGHNTVFWAAGADQASGGSGGRTAFWAVDADPASGGSGGRTWYIRTGQYTTLAEVFWKGRRDFTCAQLYRLYCNLDILIHRREHSSTKGS